MSNPWELWPVANPEGWTPELRVDLVRRLEAAREHDRQAVSAIASALEAME